MFERIAEKAKTNNNTLSAEHIHLLYTTYGFPDDLTRILADEKGIAMDLSGFQSLMEKEREESRKVLSKGKCLLFHLHLFSFYFYFIFTNVPQVVLPSSLSPLRLLQILDRSTTSRHQMTWRSTKQNPSRRRSRLFGTARCVSIDITTTTDD